MDEGNGAVYNDLKEKNVLLELEQQITFSQMSEETINAPLFTPVTQVRFTYKSLQILLEETKQGGEITISSSGMTTPLITSVNPSANIEFGWVRW